MSEVWVDPGMLVDTARVVAVLGNGVDEAKPGSLQADSSMTGSRAMAACGTGSRAAARAVAVVGDGLRRWATTADRSAAEYTRVDEATAGRLVEVGRVLPVAGDGR
ncbi:hypothetical protein [Prescottella agglutinans]|uniref:Uncharacterized protein n=1 Tax=Prescottella agglutinans TaxID=1644129 RepID=A0ABT6MLH9_9NOCA|nr:hypothetical protein [Prescottella agglutinans]MDH6284795.1 hypothetical protein [Prescottella agglutinans]